jgi:hypothetical protein
MLCCLSNLVLCISVTCVNLNQRNPTIPEIHLAPRFDIAAGYHTCLRTALALANVALDRVSHASSVRWSRLVKAPQTFVPKFSELIFCDHG